MIIVQLQRTDESNTANKIRTSVELSRFIYDNSLFAVIVHLGESATSGHYAAFFKYPDPASNCEYKWYYYDDKMNPRIVLIGSFEDMLELGEFWNPKSNGVLLFYWKPREHIGTAGSVPVG